jgi:hypothetical protein
LNGWGRLVVVAAALFIAPATADRIRDSRNELSVDECLEVLWAADELIFMIERENGRAFQFRPTRRTAWPYEVAPRSQSAQRDNVRRPMVRTAMKKGLLQ